MTKYTINVTSDGKEARKQKLASGFVGEKKGTIGKIHEDVGQVLNEEAGNLGEAIRGALQTRPEAAETVRATKAAMWASVYRGKVTTSIKERLVPIIIAIIAMFVSITLFAWIPNLYWVFVALLVYLMFPSKDDIYRKVRKRVQGTTEINVPPGVMRAAARAGMTPEDIESVLRTAVNTMGLRGDQVVRYLIEQIDNLQNTATTRAGGASVGGGTTRRVKKKKKKKVASSSLTYLTPEDVD